MMVNQRAFKMWRIPTGFVSQNLFDGIYILSFALLEFDLSRSSKVKCDGAYWTYLIDFLLMFDSNMWSITRLLYEIPAFKI